MSREQVIKCDICGTVKKEVNFWWKFWIYEDPPLHDRFVVAKAEDRSPNIPPDYKDACGPRCLGTALDRWLTSGTFDVPREIKD